MSDPFEDSLRSLDQDDRGGVIRDGHGKYLIPNLPKDFREQFAEKGYAEPTGPPRAWTRTTTIAKILSDGFTRLRWERRLTTKGMSISPDLIALAAATPVTNRSVMDSVAAQAADRAAARARANLGTALHAFTEQKDAGEDPYVPEPWDKDVAEYSRVVQAHELEFRPELIEFTIVNEALDLAGQVDRAVRYQGRWKIADLKTGRTMDYGAEEINIQLGVYATADAIWCWDRRVFLPMPEGIDTEEALVIHLPAGEARGHLYRADLRTTAEDVALARQVQKWRSRKVPLRHIPEPAPRPDAPDLPTDPWAEDEIFGAPSDAAGTERIGLHPEGLDAPEPPEPDDFPEEAPAALVDGLGDPLAPFAAPGKRGCSKCRRVGHRATSARCLGDRDPGTAGAAEAVPADHPGMTEQTCPHTKGWTRDAMTGEMVCGTCGAPAAPPIPAEPDPEPAPEPQEMPFSVAEEPEPVPEAAPATPEPQKPVQDVQEEIEDPFADAPAAPPTWAEKFQRAGSVQALAELGRQAKEAGALTPELLAIGKARRSELL